jgi:hypothetical protein
MFFRPAADTPMILPLASKKGLIHGHLLAPIQSAPWLCCPQHQGVWFQGRRRPLWAPEELNSNQDLRQLMSRTHVQEIAFVGLFPGTSTSLPRCQVAGGKRRYKQCQANFTGRCCLQFARGRDAGFMQYAIKFFFTTSDFHMETDLYRHPLIRETLPRLVYANENANGKHCSTSGFPFPPYMVLERGMSLAECAAATSSLSVCLSSSSIIVSAEAPSHDSCVNTNHDKSS